MSNLNIYSVNGQLMPATSVQMWTEQQLDILSNISSDHKFARWHELCISEFEYKNNWKPSPRRSVLFSDKDGALHLVILSKYRIIRHLVCKDQKAIDVAV